MQRIFFFQAEDGIRGRNVTGVQTCALPISSPTWTASLEMPSEPRARKARELLALAREEYRGRHYLECLDDCEKIGRASCRERVYIAEGGVSSKKKLVEVRDVL